MSEQKDLKINIEKLTEEISTKVSRQEFDDIETLLATQENLINELVAASTPREVNNDLLVFLTSVQNRNKTIIETLKGERDQLKSSILTLSKVKQYIND